MTSSTTTGGHCFFLVVALFLLSSSSAAYGELSADFYARNCSSLDQIIKTEVSRTLAAKDGRRMGASLLRLFFHDCFVQGCEASVLLGDKDDVTSEKTANPNANSLRGFDVIDRIKGEVEKSCPGVVSCADILALVAKQAVVALGGQGWPLLLGRRDSTTANKAQANSDLPSPNSDLPTLIAAFRKKNFTPEEMVALSGSHTIGLAHCTNVDQSQMGRCSIVILDDANNFMAQLDEQTPEKFDNLYYGNLLPKNNIHNNDNRGLLRSDRVLVDDNGPLKDLVGKYAKNQTLFFQDFANAMKKMSEMSVLTGTNGQIRSDCKKVNH